MPPLYAFSATELAQQLREGKVTSRAVVEAQLERIDALNPGLGAVTVTLRESALAAADAADQAAARGEARGPLHGVPFTVKENIDCLGTATTHGVPLLRNALPYADAPVVERLKAAGAIPIARTNLSEMGLRLCTSNPLRGRTLNPFDRFLTVGGSSGGDAVAVATGMSPLSLGNDMGGSLRIPAHCCGVMTLKPTTGRIPHAASLEPRDHGMAGQAMLAPGPMARTVADLRLSLKVLAGRDIRDPRSVDVPLEGPTPDVYRAALVTSLPGTPLEAGTVEAIERAGALLQAAGWEVEEAEPPELIRVNEVFGRLLATDLSVLAYQLQPVVSEALFAHLVRITKKYPLHEASNHRIHTERSRLMRAWSGFFAEYPVVIGPNWATPFWPIDADLDPTKGLALIEETVRFVTPGNILGIPCVALPMGRTHGLPLGIQIYADLWREDLCLKAAEVIEVGMMAGGILLGAPIEPVG